MLISIIIPCYNGSKILEENLPDFLAYLRTTFTQIEVIIVDDGSADHEQARAVTERNGCTFLRNVPNQGKGAAVQTGMLHAKGDICFFTDADIPFEYTNIKDYTDALASGSDIVIGDRTLSNSLYYTDISGSRRLGSRIFSLLVRLMISSGRYDTQCGLKAFKKAVAKDIFPKLLIKRFAFDVEVLFIAGKRNYRIAEVPVQLRNHSTTSVSVLSDGIKMLLDIFVIHYNNLRGRYNTI